MIPLPPPSTIASAAKTLASVSTAKAAGKSFIKSVKNIFKKKIKPKLGEHLYRYTSNQIGWFASATGQHFGSACNAIAYLRDIGLNARVPSDALVYIKSPNFGGYRLINHKLWDGNRYSEGTFVTEGERNSLKNNNAYDEIAIFGGTGPAPATQQVTGKEPSPTGTQKKKTDTLLYIGVGAVVLFFAFTFLKRKKS